MTKADFVAKIAENGGISKSAADASLKAFIASLQDVLASEGKLVLPGFGTFSVEERAARQGRNPQTGEAIAIPASKSVKFKAGAKLREAVK
ncbi:MAG: HU family DNA-binding protein [Desulfovibrio sp.]|jgi:DNA-binding protein HU-beta|nr:HU family DNA-binding protein [Mailhella sp.]